METHLGFMLAHRVAQSLFLNFLDRLLTVSHRAMGAPTFFNTIPTLTQVA